MNLTTNIKHYPEWTAYLKDRQPKTLIVWGRNDPLILPVAAEFVKQVVPAADLRYFDGGHFVLDEYADAVAEAIIETFPDEALHRDCANGSGRIVAQHSGEKLPS